MNSGNIRELFPEARFLLRHIFAEGLRKAKILGAYINKN